MAIVDPTAKVDASAQFGADCVIGAFVMIGIDGPRNLPAIIGNRATFRSHAIVYSGCKIGDCFHMAHHAMIRERTEIGDCCSVGTQSVIEHHVKIGNDVRIHSQAFVPEFSVIGDGAWLGPRSCLTNAKFPASRTAKDHLRGVIIEPRARIGANATILPGVVIGAESLVGAGSVVTRNVPPKSVVAGNPARVIGNIDELRYDELPDFSPYE